MVFWPFKTGDDSAFHKSPGESSIYTSLGELPPYDYETEVRRYHEARWKKGMIHSLFPAFCCGSGIGLVYGLYQARHNIRHISRPRVVFQSIFSFTSICLSVASTHHFLVVAQGYKQSDWQAILSGMMGGLTFSMTSATGITSGVIGGFFIGVVYAGGCYGVKWWQKRALTNFLVTQQSRQTPVHRIAPELQPMYRAFLYDHRPIEDSDELRRRALLLERTATDTRLDAQAFLEAINSSKLFNCISFPEWWPLRFSPQNDEQALIEQRRKDDQYERRLRTLSEPRASIMTEPFFRSKTALGKPSKSA